MYIPPPAAYTNTIRLFTTSLRLHMSMQLYSIIIITQAYSAVFLAIDNIYTVFEIVL